MKKIIFFGTPDFATESLRKILSQDYNVCGVVTSPDKMSGRGMKIHKSPIKLLAEEHNLNIIQTNNLNDDNFYRELKDLEPDLFVVVAFKKLPEKIWKIPKYGTFNVHASLLPNYRGAAPINWVLINGEKETGLTTFFIDNRIDCGEIIMQVKCEINKNESFEDLHKKLMKLSPQITLETIEKIFKGNLKTKKQRLVKNFKKAPKIYKRDIIINWRKDGYKIYNFIRGFSPFPGARTTMKIINTENQIKYQDLIITSVSNFQKKKINTDDIHQLIYDNEEKKIYIQNNNYRFTVDRLKVPGKKELDGISFANGFLNKKENQGYIQFI